MATPRRAREIVRLESAARHASRRNVRRTREEDAGCANRSGPAPPPASRKTSVCEGRRAQPRARPPVFLARRREDVEHDTAHAERAAAVRHVRRRLPEVAGLHVMLDAVLDADPIALEAHAPLLVRVRVHRRDRTGLQRDHGEHRVHAGEHARAHAGRELPFDAARFQIVEAGDVGHFLAPFSARRFALPRAIRAITLCLAVPSLVTAASPLSRRVAMPSPAFYATDFKVFDEQGFRARMGAIRARIRPKLEAVGHSLTPAVSRATGGDAYAHVAKHARRTVNPPEDTWVAFGPDARGYKKHCHFKVAVSRRAVRFLFEVGPEHADKKRWAAAWKRNAPRLAPVLRRGKGLAWFKNEHDEEAATPLADLSPERLAELADELTRTRDGQLVLGRVVPAEQAARWTEAQYRDTALETFRALAPLYRLKRAERRHA